MLLLASTGESIYQLIVVLFIFVGVLAITYYTTRWIAGYQKSRSFNNNLEVVETLKITPNKYIQIIRAGEDTYYVLPIGKDEVVHLGTLSKEQLQEVAECPTASSMPQVDFKSILDKFTKK